MEIEEYDYSNSSGAGSGLLSRIIYCSDLILRIDNPNEEISNITEWLHSSTDFRPAYPEGCVLRQEVGAMGKLSVIFVVWLALVILTTFYCYFCEQRLFPRQKLLDWSNAHGHGQKGGSLFKWRSNRNSPSSYTLKSPPSSTSLLSLSSVAPNSVRRERTPYCPSSAAEAEGPGSELKFREFRQLPAEEEPPLHHCRPPPLQPSYAGDRFCPPIAAAAAAASPGSVMASSTHYNPYYKVYEHNLSSRAGLGAAAAASASGAAAAGRGFYETRSESTECLTSG